MATRLTLYTLLVAATTANAAAFDWLKIANGATGKIQVGTGKGHFKHRVAEVIAECPDNLLNATLSLPTAGAVEVDAAQAVATVALGIGEQSYTCQDSAWVLTSVTAQLYDISCNYNKSSISALSQSFNGLAGQAITAVPLADTVSSKLGSTLPSDIFGDVLHRLGKLSSSDASTYTFDFRRAAGGPMSNASDFTTGKVSARQSAPVASYDVDWLRVDASSGDLAKSVFQVQTAGGYPNTLGLACTNGKTDNVPFSAQYWFYNPAVGVNGTTNAKATVPVCEVATTAAAEIVAVLTTAVEYGTTLDSCSSIDDCSAKCKADSNCVGFILSTEDNEGYTKSRVGDGKLGYSPYFTSGVKLSITNKQYVTRQGEVDDCPSGQITSPDFLGCQVPVC